MTQTSDDMVPLDDAVRTHRAHMRANPDRRREHDDEWERAKVGTLVMTAKAAMSLARSSIAKAHATLTEVADMHEGRVAFAKEMGEADDVATSTQLLDDVRRDIARLDEMATELAVMK